ncbi:MAG: hypothetical protein J6K29_07035 [Clostridia bacterium]|nr:hypothetical protein [Clostridia bacterium]MBP3666789.1 hypothetical protein [Clostridia bacterium]
MKPTIITDEMIEKMKKKGIKSLIVNGVKSLLFYAILFSALFYIEGSEYNTLFTKESQPVWFWGVFVIILTAPIWMFKLYRLILNPTYYGEVTDVKISRTVDARVLTGYDRSIKGTVDTCTVTVISKFDIEHHFTFRQEEALFAHDYFRVGDRVFHYVFSDIPVNLSNDRAAKYCPRCGTLGAECENVCAKCNIPFIQCTSKKDP